MNQQGIRPRQASPLSMESTDSSFLTRYQTMSPIESSYGTLSTAPGTHASPPPYPNTSTENSRPPSNRTPSGSNGHMSSASSAARSSGGKDGLHSPIMSESGRSHSSRHEDALTEHYHVLKGYLKSYLEKDVGVRPTRARDKLLRLSPTQFLELSTDVYDEFLRREDFRQRGSDVVPKSLPPKTTFHPKRNQARQKLSTLPPERFRQLATDVYYELERRVPRLGGGDLERTASPAFSTASGQRGPSRNGPSPGARPGPPGPPGAGYRVPVGNGNRPPPGRTASSEFGRPLPKQFQSNTIVPNKSTMVEDDETDDEDDPLGIETVVNGLTKRSTSKSNGSDQESNRAYEVQISELQDRMSSLEDQLRDKDSEIEQSESARRQRELDFGTEKDEWTKSRGDFEKRLAELQGSADAHNAALDRTHENHAKREESLREQMDHQVTELRSQLDTLHQENAGLRLQGGSSERDMSDNEWQHRCQMLEEELANQQKLTEDVRQNATQFLQEMRTLSEQSDAALEKEEQLRSQMTALQAEVDEWKTRYAKTKTQLRTLKASSIGLPLQRMAGNALSARQGLLSKQGVVNDVDVTNFQMSIDELLSTARQGVADETLDRMKSVVHHVQEITGNETNGDLSGFLSPVTSPNPMSPQLNGNGSPPTSSALKARVSRNANGLITATRNFVSASGLSPVSLVDVAAANLTAAVVDYVKTVGIKASPAEHLRQDADADADADADSEADEGYELLAPKTHDPVQPIKSAEPKLNGGWFNRLKGSFDSSYSNENAEGSRDEEDDFDAYR